MVSHKHGILSESVSQLRFETRILLLPARGTFLGNFTWIAVFCEHPKRESEVLHRVTTRP